jgi:hypothetical protein
VFLGCGLPPGSAAPKKNKAEDNDKFDRSPKKGNVIVQLWMHFGCMHQALQEEMITR